MPGRVPGRVPGCAGSFRLVPRSKKTVSRSEKHMESQFHKLGIHVIQLAVSLWVFSSHSVNSF